MIRLLGLREVLCCHEDPWKADARYAHFRRITFGIDAGNELFDTFFNSAEGYRAAYYKSPGIGLDVNREIIEGLMSALVASPLTAAAGVNPEFVKQSLQGQSAKIWVAEKGHAVVEECPACKGEWSDEAGPIEILNDRWKPSDENYKAKWGCRAPLLTKIKVFGAFIDDCGNELIAANKLHRAQEISDYGWS